MDDPELDEPSDEPPLLAPPVREPPAEPTVLLLPPPDCDPLTDPAPPAVFS